MPRVLFGERLLLLLGGGRRGVVGGANFKHRSLLSESDRCGLILEIGLGDPGLSTKACYPLK